MKEQEKVQVVMAACSVPVFNKISRTEGSQLQCLKLYGYLCMEISSLSVLRPEELRELLTPLS